MGEKRMIDTRALPYRLPWYTYNGRQHHCLVDVDVVVVVVTNELCALK